MGMGMVALTAGLPNLRPPSCPEESDCTQPKPWQLSVLFGGLALLALGSGGIRSCNIAFGADQFDTKTEKGRTQLKSFFNWWYFSFTVALLIALTVVVYVQTNVSWFLGFVIPTACLAVSITIFLLGRRVYVCMKPQGSVFVDICKVIIAAWRKRKVTAGPESAFYNPPESESEQQNTVPPTDRFKYLDKAAIILDPNELNPEGFPGNNWRLCSIQQVERLKCLVGIVPVWFTGIACFIAMDQMNTFGILQAIQSNTTIHNFKVPPGWMGLTSMISLATWIFIYECIYVACARKLTGKEDVRFSTKQKIRVGIVMSILCMLVAGFMERKRREAALETGSFVSPVSIALLLPQFVLSGLLEAFAAVAIMEFFNNQVPESMRSVAGSVFFLSLSMASYLNSVLVNVVHALSGRNGRSPWLGGRDLNANRLDYFYFTVAALGVVNFAYFNLFAHRYVFVDVGSREREATERLNEPSQVRNVNSTAQFCKQV
ncbi:protein NRT1/ PTR FAMILY 2.8 isoform X2 [Rhododendron vialii]|uniref:protein NRT1/ PTR FAMILY 2.8 isoform X2 n=1 Tax=Rhododendron vialii TaxID=182163 RepID=UPI00265ECD4D|nr:protein NRT1/ PTR FAMILY 2.8 isoform X2 [Rhododendron vialii]